jgi:hypothetical protein
MTTSQSHPRAFKLYLKPVQFQARGKIQRAAFPTTLVRFRLPRLRLA